jgi:hypothetical protein
MRKGCAGAEHTKMVSPSDEHAMELIEFKFLEYTKPRKKASFNKDKSARDLQFHIHKKRKHIDFTLVSTGTSKSLSKLLPHLISIFPLEKTSISPMSLEEL